MNRAVLLIARREIVTRWQQKGYRIGVAVTLVIAIVGVTIPSFFSSGATRTTYDIAVVGVQPGLADALKVEGAVRGAKVDIHASALNRARQKVESGDWDAAVSASRIVVPSAGDAVVDVIESARVLAVALTALARPGSADGLPASELSLKPATVVATKSADESQRQTLALITVIVLFSQLIAFCTWVATGVVEEKSSRVVELLLSSVRPIQLLTGKLLGIGALATAQVAALAGAALIAATAAGTLTLPAADLLTVVISFMAFVLGFVFFAAVSAALASTVSRQEEVSGVLAPVSMVLTLCYFAGFAAMADGASTLGRVLSIVPPVSCIAMPARIARGQASVLDVVLAIVLLLAVSLAALTVAARIYRASILHTGARLKLRQAWRGEPVAESP